MVMATVSACQQFSGELTHEAGDATDNASAAAAALHERLVAYVHALAGGHEPRSGVWVEHSYARSRAAAHAPSAHVRVLLAPSLPDEHADIDVERVEPGPPELPGCQPEPEPDDSDTEHDDDWEARATALAPSAAHSRLAEHALDALRRMRLERLAGGRCDTAARTAARRLRLALAAAAAHPGAHTQRPGPWLHATLLSCLPRVERRLYDEMVAELQRAAPRLAERMLAGRALTPRLDPLAAVGPALGDTGPWLVWLGCGRARLDARWVRRLGALVHTRVLAGEGGGRRLAPDVWCANVAGNVRSALADTLVEAGERPVILGGIGAGAALVTALASTGGSRVRGLLLLAPPLVTAAGARDAPDDVLWELRMPLLLVAGAGAAGCWRGAVREAARGGEGGARGGEGGVRRVLEVRGADDALRLPAAVRRRRRLPQHALDAAVAEECARWVMETASATRSESPVRERQRRRARAERGNDSDDEYAHLPPAVRYVPPAPLGSGGSDRAMETVAETTIRRGPAVVLDASNSVSLTSGRVVSRGSGATPLALLPPRRRPASPPAVLPPRRRPTSPPAVLPPRRRPASPPVVLPPRRRAVSPIAVLPPRRRAVSPAAVLPPRRRPASPPAPAPAPPALQPADIMRLPIVFADDEPALDEPAATPVTVTSGSRTYTRVIVASRGGPHRTARGRPGPVRPVTVRPGTVRPGAAVLRRGLRLMRADRPP